MLYQRFFKPVKWAKEILGKGKRGVYQGSPHDLDWNALLKIAESKEIQEFCKFLELTAQEKVYILSSINLFDEKQRQEAIKIQYTMAGMLSVPQILEAIKQEVKEKGESKNGESN